MDRGPDIPVNFSERKCQKVDETTGRTFVDEAAEVKHLLAEPKSDNLSVDALLGIDEENSGRVIRMEEVSRGFELGFTSNYGGLDSYNALECEDGLKLEIFDGFLDEVDEVDDIYAAQDLSTACNHFLLDFEFTEKVSELDCDLHRGSNSGSESHSSGSSGSIDGSSGVSESSKDAIPASGCRNKCLDKEASDDEHEKPKSNYGYQELAKDSMISASNAIQKFDELGDDEKPIASFIVSEKRGRISIQETELGTCFNKKSLHKNTHRPEASPQASYDFRPRRGCTKKCPPAMDQQSDHELTASEFEDDHPKAKASRSRGDRRKHQRMWTLCEVMKLVDGISQFGVGKWTDIKRLLFPSATYRTPIDLRDKWRNLLRASYSLKERQKPNRGEGEEKSRHAMRPLPKQIVHRIHELAALHPYPNSKPSVRRTPRRKNQI